MFYYAGHGLQVGGENYIVPIDAKLEQELDLAFQALPLAQVTSAIERQDRTAILILDACRDNPFVPRISRTLSRSRSTGQGLAGISPGLGTLVVFATDPGKVAFDGQGANSPFTTSLARHMETPGLEIRQVMTRVRLDVLQATDGAQRPWDNSSLLSDVYLAPAVATSAGADAAPAQVAAVPTGPAVAPSATDEQRYWDGVQQIGDPERKGRALEGYLKEFPQGRFAMLAGIQIEEIKARAAEPQLASTSAQGRILAGARARPGHRPDERAARGDYAARRIRRARRARPGPRRRRSAPGTGQPQPLGLFRWRARRRARPTLAPRSRISKKAAAWVPRAFSMASRSAGSRVRLRGLQRRNRPSRRCDASDPRWTRPSVRSGRRPSLRPTRSSCAAHQTIRPGPRGA